MPLPHYQSHAVVNVVEAFNGNTWQLHVDPQISIASFKSRLAEVSGVPSDLQQIVHGTEILGDRIRLGDRIPWEPGIEPVSLSMLISIGGLHASALKRQNTLISIVELGSKRRDISHTVLSEVLKCFADENSKHVKAEAQKTMDCLAGNLKGDERAIATALGLVAHDDPALMAAGLLTVARVAMQGDERVSNVALQCCTAPHDHMTIDQRITVTVAALEALARIAMRGDERVIAAVIECCTAPDHHMTEEQRRTLRIAALKTLAQVSKHGDQQVVTVTIQCVHDFVDNNQFWRDGDGSKGLWQAVETLAQVAQQGDQRVIEAIIATLQNPGGRLGMRCGLACVRRRKKRLGMRPGRQTALNALAVVAVTGDERATEAVMAHLEDSDVNARDAAKTALSVLVKKRKR